MLAEFLFPPIEMLLNRGLGQSTSAQALAKDLDGRTLGLTVEGTPFDLRLRISGGRINVTVPDGVTPDACISGSPLSLGRLLGDDPRAPVRDGSVRMTGDAELADQFRDLLHFTAPDIEEELSRLVGDPIAHQVGNATRAFAVWGEAAGESVARSVSEYLQEESRILPTRSEMEEFTGKVDELVNDVARAEVRLRRLKEAL